MVFFWWPWLGNQGLFELKNVSTRSSLRILSWSQTCTFKLTNSFGEVISVLVNNLLHSQTHTVHYKYSNLCECFKGKRADALAVEWRTWQIFVCFAKKSVISPVRQVRPVIFLSNQILSRPINQHRRCRPTSEQYKFLSGVKSDSFFQFKNHDLKEKRFDFYAAINRWRWKILHDDQYSGYSEKTIMASNFTFRLNLQV